MLKIYLAGPGVFLSDPHTYFANKRSICVKHNFIGISPFDSELNPIHNNPFDIGVQISANNERLMRTCDLIVADLTPWHGPSADVGTCFELGFMRALNKPLFAYSNVITPFSDRVENAFGKASGKDVLGRRLINGIALEEFDMVDNLMMHGAICHSNSTICVRDIPEHERYTSLLAFEDAVQYASRALNK